MDTQTLIRKFDKQAKSYGRGSRKKVQTWCKPGGKILLMEHGRSSYRLLGWLQDRLDRWQYCTAGCHPNRDMMQIIKAAGLHIDKAEHKFFNSVHLVWGRPDKSISL